MFIPLTKPYFNNKEVKAVQKVLKSGWVVQGPKVKEFEEKFAKFVGAKYAIATTSCTTALHLSLVSLGIGKGDEVIVPAFTFVATANAVEYTGAKPVFADIESNTFNISPELVEGLITPRTKAIIPVHLFGLAAKITPILKIAQKYKLKIIEDAACGLGSFYKNKHAGTFGDCGCFSLHPRKAITAGEGGIITTNSKKLADRLVSLRDHGASMSDLARHQKGLPMLPEYNQLGFNYRMTDIQGAILCEQFKKLQFILKERREKAEIYNKALKNSKFFEIPFVPQNYFHSYQSYVLLVKDGFSRDKIANKLIEKGITVRQGTQSVPHLGFYKKKYGYTNKDYPISLKAERQTLTIPLFATMTKKEQDFVINNLVIS